MRFLLQLVLLYLLSVASLSSCIASDEVNTNLTSDTVNKSPVIKLENFNLDIEAISRVDERLIIAGQYGFLAYSDNNGKTWARSDSQTSHTLKSITHHSDSLIAVGLQGVIRRSFDQGSSWQIISSPVSENLNTVTKINQNKFVAVGDRGVILISQNGGESWSLIASGTNQNLNSVAFINTNIGFATGKNGCLLQTKDGGNTWQAIDTGLKYNSLLGVSFFDETNGVIVGDGGAILVTHDGGLTWELKSSQMNRALHKALYLDSAKLIVIGDRAILISHDGGQSWSYMFNAYGGELRDIEVSVTNSLFVVGRYGAMLESKSLNSSWSIKRGRNNYPPSRIRFADERIIIATDGRSIYRSFDGAKTWEATYECSDGLDLRELFFRQLDFGIAVCSNKLLHSVDQGKTWQVVSETKSHHFANGTDISGQNIITLGNHGEIFLSKNGGETWSQPTSNTENNLIQVKFLDKKNVLATGSRATILRSHDAGESWQTISHELKGLYHVADFDTLDGKNIFAVDMNGVIIISNDAGYTWRISSSGHDFLNIVRVLDDKHIFASGFTRVVYSDSGGLSWQATKVDKAINELYVTPQYAIRADENAQRLKSFDKGKTWQNIILMSTPVGKEFEFYNESLDAYP